MSILYRHIRIDKNEPFYIGIGINEKRAYSKYGRNAFWKNIVAKTDYEVEILLESDDYEFIKQKEIEFIALYGRRDLEKGTLVNLTDGGDGMLGNMPSIETREKLSSLKIGTKLSGNTKNKISDSIKNTDSFGVRGLKISNSLKNYYKNNKKVHSVETKNKISDSSLGKKLSEETKQKMSDSKGTNVVCILTGLEWNSISNCAKYNNLNYNTLKNKLNGSRKNNTSFRVI